MPTCLPSSLSKGAGAVKDAHGPCLMEPYTCDALAPLGGQHLQECYHRLQGLGNGEREAAVRADPRGFQGEGGGGPGGPVLDPSGAVAQVQVCRSGPEEPAAAAAHGRKRKIQYRTQRFEYLSFRIHSSFFSKFYNSVYSYRNSTCFRTLKLLLIFYLHTFLIRAIRMKNTCKKAK